MPFISCILNINLYHKKPVISLGGVPVVKVSARIVVLTGVVTVLLTTPAAAAIPYFARKYEVPCSRCHLLPPKLNEFGEAFRQRGYLMPDGRAGRATIPLALWVSGRSDAFPREPQVRDAVRAYVNKVEVISGGQIVAPWLSYFVEWRPVSLETRSRDGEVGLRDRSGRFEDLMVTASTGNLALTLGQYRLIDQVDVSLRLGLSEPLPLAASVPGQGEGTARIRSLRGFAPAGRSPAARLAWRQPLSAQWSWTTSAAVPLPGEFSIPLSREARIEASNELEWSAKGVLVESYLRRGLWTVGGHAFYDDATRYLAQAVTSGRQGRVSWTGVVGVEHVADLTRARWSLEAELSVHRLGMVGGRLEDRAGDGTPLALLPYVRVHFPGTRYTVYLAVEQRIRRGAAATLLELGTVF